MIKKPITIFTILLVVLVSALFFYKQTYRIWPWQTVASPSPTVIISPLSSVTPQANSQREKIMIDVASKIAQLSPEQPVLGGHWFVERFWFVSGSDSNLYVEYEDGHLLDRILLTAQPKGVNFSYKTVAFFTAGESDWVLQSGKDEQFGKNLDLYEYDSVQKVWVKKN